MSTLHFKHIKSGQIFLELPLSKSVLNRELILAAFSDSLPALQSAAELAEDSHLLYRALTSKDEVKDIGHAGTAMRFLTAYFACTDGEHVLAGSSRMHERPIGILVEALRTLGADIVYLEKDGFPPLKISGKKLQGGQVKISGAVSSQFISALLLCAPTFEHGLQLELIPPVTSRPYIGLTLAALKRSGVACSLEGNSIHIAAQKVNCTGLSLERDWSAAAFGYGLVAMGCCEELILPGLDVKTWQGDSILGQLFAQLGIETGQSSTGVHLTRKTGPPSHFSQDMGDCPDLAQALVFTCAALGVSCDLWGLQTLPLKETNRILAMVECLKTVGIHAEHGTDFIRFHGKMKTEGAFNFKTYKDHRMAMSLALWVPALGRLSLDDPSAVRKSFPGFWEELKKLGIHLEG